MALDLHNLVTPSSENELFTADAMGALLRSLGLEDRLHVHDIEHYRQAFVHRSYTGGFVEAPLGSGPVPTRSNERDEFFGDSLIGCAVAGYLLARLPDADEGQLTHLRAKIVSSAMLSTLAAELGLARFMLLAPNVERTGTGRARPSLLAGTFEAFVAAVYADQAARARAYVADMGLEWGAAGAGASMLEMVDPTGYAFAMASAFVVAVVERWVDLTALLTTETNYKDLLTKHYQKTYHATPDFVDVGKDGPPHDPVFSVTVRHVDGTEIGAGTGRTKRKAQHAAAEQAMRTLGVAAQYT
jgi:ribonuclease-3